MLSISRYVSIMMTGIGVLPTIGWAAEQMVLTREDQRPVTVVKYIPQQHCQGIARLFLMVQVVQNMAIAI